MGKRHACKTGFSAAGIAVALVGLAAPWSAAAFDLPQSAEVFQSDLVEDPVTGETDASGTVGDGVGHDGVDRDAADVGLPDSPGTPPPTGSLSGIVSWMTLESMEGKPGSDIGVSGDCSWNGETFTSIWGHLRKLSVEGQPTSEVYSFRIVPPVDSGDGAVFETQFVVPLRATPGQYQFGWSCGGADDMWEAEGVLDEPFVVLESDMPPPPDLTEVNVQFSPLKVRGGDLVDVTGKCINMDGELADGLYGALIKQPADSVDERYEIEMQLVYYGGSTTFDTIFRIPEKASPGLYKFKWSCGDLASKWSSESQTTTFTILPTPVIPKNIITFDPLKGHPGDAIAISGQCVLPPDKPARSVWGTLVKLNDKGERTSERYHYEVDPTYKKNSTKINAEFRIPMEATPGKYMLTWYCGEFDMVWYSNEEGYPFTVLGGANDAGKELAETGISGEMLIASGVLLAVGSVILIGSRSKRLWDL